MGRITAMMYFQTKFRKYCRRSGPNINSDNNKSVASTKLLTFVEHLHV